MSTLRRHGLFLKGGAAASWVPLDADVLLKHTKTSTVKYTKITTTAWDGYAYRNIASQVGSEIKETNPSATVNRFVGFYNDGLTDADKYKNFDYAIQASPSGGTNFRAWERGVQKYSEASVMSTNTVIRIKKIAGAAEYYADDILKYTSIQDFNGAKFGCSVYNINEFADEMYYKL